MPEITNELMYEILKSISGAGRDCARGHGQHKILTDGAGWPA